MCETSGYGLFSELVFELKINMLKVDKNQGVKPKDCDTIRKRNECNVAKLDDF